MRVAVATAEPFAAYHLTALVDEADARCLHVEHLLPIDHPTQGAAFPTVAALAAALTADRVVVTGGRLNAWTEAVARTAATRGVPVVFAELAYLDGAAHPDPPPLTAALATSTRSAQTLRHHLGPGAPAIDVIGSPLLDNLPEHHPVRGRILVLGTVSNESPDNGSALRAAATRLRAAGWDVVVRLHPREPVDAWSEFTLDRSLTPAAAAATAERVVGYPGTAFVPMAAMGVPVLGLATEPWMFARVPDDIAELAEPVEDLDDLTALLEQPRVVDAAVVEQVTGPVGGAAARLWDAVAAAAP